MRKEGCELKPGSPSGRAALPNRLYKRCRHDESGRHVCSENCPNQCRRPRKALSKAGDGRVPSRWSALTVGNVGTPCPRKAPSFRKGKGLKPGGGSGADLFLLQRARVEGQPAAPTLRGAGAFLFRRQGFEGREQGLGVATHAPITAGIFTRDKGHQAKAHALARCSGGFIPPRLPSR